jgi:hypothetical protein
MPFNGDGAMSAICPALGVLALLGLAIDRLHG